MTPILFGEDTAVTVLFLSEKSDLCLPLNPLTHVRAGAAFATQLRKIILHSDLHINLVVQRDISK